MGYSEKERTNDSALTGTIVSFPDNNLNYFQDFRFRRGVPTNIEFTVQEKTASGRYWLVADGYGNREKPHAYGNGRIAVKEEDIKWAMFQSIVSKLSQFEKQLRNILETLEDPDVKLSLMSHEQVRKSILKYTKKISDVCS